MRVIRWSAGLAAALALSAPESVQGQQLVQMEFATFSGAVETREAVESAGHATSSIEFADTVWIFRTGLSPDLPSSSPDTIQTVEQDAGPCSSGAGVTRCNLYSSAARERGLMESMGWALDEGIYFDVEAQLWAFRWSEPDQYP